MNTLFDTGKPEQNLMAFPESLPDRYQPHRVEDFIGLARPKQFIASFLKSPRPAPLLFIGPPGAGKSVMGVALAEALGTLVHVGAQRCDVAQLEALQERFAYYPPKPSYWVVVVDEADQMTERAQLHLLSKMDFAASMIPTFGGGSIKSEAPGNVIWVFTCNGRGAKGVEPPPNLAPRFLSRCMVVEFEAASQDEIADHCRTVWAAEGGGETPEGYFNHIADCDGVRAALNRLQTDLLAGPRAVPQKTSPGPVLVVAAKTGREVNVEDIIAEASTFLEGEVVVWETGGRYRVGVRTRTPGRYVEDGKLMIGAGATPAAALKDARKRARKSA